MTDVTVAIDGPGIDPFLCKQCATIRDALSRMNSTPDIFQLVVDSKNHLLGTITDGDVRRALLAGAVLDDVVAKFMNATPVTGLQRDIASANKRLDNIQSPHRFLPLLDEEGKVVAILVRRHAAPEAPMALVMAGGRGQRLQERTLNVPKPLLHVRGRPMLEHVLRTIEAAGIRKVFVSTHYLSEQIDKFCAERKGAADLQILHERTPFGTAGALSLVPDEFGGPLLIMNGDVVSNVDLAAMYNLHMHHGWDATIAVARHEIEIPYGVVHADIHALFIRIEEKPHLRHFVAAGIYLLNNRIRSLVPKDTYIDMPELLQSGRDAGLKIGVFPIHESWRDVGRPADLEAANKDPLTLT